MLGTVRGAAAGVVSTSAKPLLAPSECGLSHADAGPIEETMKNAAAHVARTHRVMSVRRSTEAANGRSVFAMLHPLLASPCGKIQCFRVLPQHERVMRPGQKGFC